MTTKTAQKWAEILRACGVRPSTAARWAPVFAAEIKSDTFSAGDAELDEFLGQVLHESGMLEMTEEGLVYSAERLCAVWPRRFPSIAAAQPYARNPQKLANHVYGGRLGNVLPNDGWDCRGSGLIQVTGLSNLTAVANAMGWREDPRKLGEALRKDPATALRASIIWWEKNISDAIVHDNDVVRETKAVNGGTIGLAHRQKVTAAAREALA